MELYSNLLNAVSPTLHHTCLCHNHVERSDISIDCPNVNEIENAINRLKKNKAPGLDNISPELLMADSNVSAQLIEPIISQFWETSSLHEELKEGVIIKIPKKGDLTNCKNWRGITLLSMINKIITIILNTRLSDALQPDIRCEQAGFRPNKSCVDHINSLRIITEQSCEWRSPLYLTFVDFEKAFDTINQSQIWSNLRCRGIPKKLISLLEALYKNANCRIAHEDLISEAIKINIGVRQGCPLSPLLFNLAIDSIMRFVTSERRGIVWGLSGRLEDLDYADDICLLSHNYNDMQQKLNKLVEEADKYGLKINIPKTKTMRINSANTQSLSIQQQSLEEVDSFCYLGSIITKSGGSHEDVMNRINQARRAYGQLNPVWRSNIISLRTKCKIFDSCVKSVLLYGCEAWNTASRDIQSLQVFVNRCLRRLLKVFWPNHISNQRLWNLTGHTPIYIEVRRRKWRWIGHALRRPYDDVTRNAIDWNPQGSRRRGRPSHTWRRQLDAEAAVAMKSWNELKALAADKLEWNKFVEALCSLQE